MESALDASIKNPRELLVLAGRAKVGLHKGDEFEGLDVDLFVRSRTRIRFTLDGAHACRVLAYLAIQLIDDLILFPLVRFSLGLPKKRQPVFLSFLKPLLVQVWNLCGIK